MQIPRHASYRQITASAYELHRSVPADRWCVTCSDLSFLRQEVKDALGSGQIQPKPDDESSEYGPSIYTVNEQYIKPVTHHAGKMSWALMRNPDGLECDLFVSHAWQEGIFEFLTKVRHSWPRGLRTAWCCMLANPQNLDISAFLQSPATSPFAVALKASEVMLVVPNRHQSVYTRLWCAYEAYLAQEEGKTILIAKSSNLHQILGALCWMALAATLGAAAGIVATLCGVHGPQGVPLLAILLIGFSLVVNRDMTRRVMHLLGEVLSWIHVTAQFNSVFSRYNGDEVSHRLHVSYWLLTAAAFCVMEVDRINARSTLSEAEELRQGYQGSIQYAKCSKVEDAASIHQEIGDELHRVDHAIHVLLTAGMSTPALREIAQAVEIEGAAFAEISGAFLLLGPFASMAVTLTLEEVVHGRGSWYEAALAVTSLLSRVILFMLLCIRHWDEQCFILKVMNKFLFVAMLGWLFMNLQTLRRAQWLLFTDLCLLFMVCFALLGIRGIAKLPFGLSLLGIFFSRGSNACTALKACAGSNLAVNFDQIAAETESGEPSMTDSDSAPSSHSLDLPCAKSDVHHSPLSEIGQSVASA